MMQEREREDNCREKVLELWEQYKRKLNRREESSCGGYLLIYHSISRTSNLKLKGAYDISETFWLFFSTTLGGVILSLTLPTRQPRLREMQRPCVSSGQSQLCPACSRWLWAQEGCPLTLHTSLSAHHSNIQTLSLRLRPRLCKIHIYSPHSSCSSAAQCNMFHWFSYHPLSPQI